MAAALKVAALGRAMRSELERQRAETMKRGQVHRFRDSVACYVGTGETVYMAPKEARKLAAALRRAALSVETERFADSTDLTRQLQFEGVAVSERRRGVGK